MDSNFFPKIELPQYDDFLELAESACDVLEKEEESYRPKNDGGDSGSLLDFSSDKTPLILVPDLHARPFFLKNILSYKIKPELEFLQSSEELSVFEALEKNLLRIVCVGDALHTEKTTHSRWAAAYLDYLNKDYVGNAMKEEMAEGLTLLSMIMQLKKTFPKNFHFLKGNHENIMNETCDGDYAFRKYAEEGSMVQKFMSEYYDSDLLYMIEKWEYFLPLVFVGSNCIVSHAEPAVDFSRDELINARFYGFVVESLTWTQNDAAEEGSVQKMIETLLPKKSQKNALYFGGHRPVNTNYKLRQNGKYVQFHNPTKQNIAFVRPDRKFDFEKDFINVEQPLNNISEEEDER